jgi:two-component system sensor histidine kinase KdpD
VTRRAGAHVLGALGAVAVVTAADLQWLDITNTTTAALSYLLVVLIVAAVSRLGVAVFTAILSVLCLNYFFIPPLKTLVIADPRNWVALAVFLAVSFVGSHLSSVARQRTEEAIGRRDEVTRLFLLSQEILLLTDGDGSIAPLPGLIADRFALEYVAIWLPSGGDGDWRAAESGTPSVTLDPAQLAAAIAEPRHQQTLERGGRALRLIPLNIGDRAPGVLAVAGRPVEPGTLDALAGIVAIAIERSQLLAERRDADVSRRSEELKTVLLASLAHDLRTPLTAIRVAATNLQTSPSVETRRDQSSLILTEVGRLSRLFQNILDMARIDAGSIGADLRWMPASEIVEAAIEQVGQRLASHVLRVDAETEHLVRVDPRLTATALAHVIENAVQYAPPGSAIEVAATVGPDELVLHVRDHGPGVAEADLPHIFERFYRGGQGTSFASGTGMGLSIARGLLAAEHGHVSVENCPDGGARFVIVVPAESRQMISELAADPSR